VESVYLIATWFSLSNLRFKEYTKLRVELPLKSGFRQLRDSRLSRLGQVAENAVFREQPFW
jgi:hypothetical protein